MSRIIKIGANAVVAKIFNADRAEKNVLSQMLSYEADGKEYSNAYNSGAWNGMGTFFNFKEETFPAGFVDYVRKTFEKSGYVVQIVKKPLPAAIGPEEPKVDNFPEDPRYGYQMETVRRLVDKGRMIAMLATGGGKSRVAKLAYKRIGRNTLFVTTRSVLMYQMKSTFEAMGEKVGVIGDSEFSPTKGFNVAMVQTLASMLKLPSKNDSAQKQREQFARRKGIISLLSSFEFVILEEAHEIGSDSYYSVLNHCINAHYRLALTATPFMKSNSESNMRLMASVGPVGIRVSEEHLINCGILAKPYFKFISVPTPEKLRKTTSWPRCYEIGIVNNELRNAAIINEANNARKYKIPVLILVQRQAHGEILKKMLIESGAKCEFIYGKHEQEQRDKALKKLSKGTLEVLIGSVILDVGVDVPALGMIILAGGGKAEVATRQRIGRGLREKKKSANVTFIVDFDDSGNKHTQLHALARRQIIERTRGFREGILMPGVEFDYSLLKVNNG